MGSTMLFATSAVELVFAAYCIHSRSYQVTKRSVIRIGTFAGFVVLVVVSAVEWSSRWYAFAALLLIWSLLGAIVLVRGNGDREIFSSRNVIKRAILTLFIVLLALSPTLIFPQYRPLETTGVYGVETATYTYTDESRLETYSKTRNPRRLTVQYWYPEDSHGTHPLILFSHGSFGVRSSNLSLYRELASHGYVVCAIDHAYQCLFTTDTDGKTSWLDRTFMGEVFAEDAKSNKLQSYEYYQKWMGVRTRDLSFVIDYSLHRAADRNPDLVYTLIDATKIGVMGHSLGGSAALGLGRIRRDVSAVIALESPFLCDVAGVRDGEFVWNEEPYPVPALIIYSDSSWDYLNEWPQYAANAKLLANAEAIARSVHVPGAGHFTLTDLALTSPLLTRMLNGQRASTDTRYCLATINRITLAFLDHYLKGKGGLGGHGPAEDRSGVAALE